MASKLFIAWIFYSVIVGFILGGSFVWCILEPPHPLGDQQYGASNHDKPESKTKEKSPEEALARYTLALTIMTGVVALATIGLVIATCGLYFTGEKQIRIAEANTRALINAEKSHLFIGIKSDTVSAIVARNGAYQNSPTLFPMEIEEPGVGYFFKNYGRTAAILKEIGDDLIIAPEFPDVRHIEPRSLPDELVVGPNEESAVLLSYFRGFTVGDAVAFQQRNTALWFHGYVRFADAFGNETTWRYRYCYRRGYGGFRLVWYEESPHQSDNG